MRITLLSNVRACVRVGHETVTMGYYVQGDSEQVLVCIRLRHPMVIFAEPTWTNTRCLLMLSDDNIYNHAKSRL